MDIKSYTPMLLKSSLPFDSPSHIYELKLDGMRCLAFINADVVALKSRQARDITLQFPELANINKCVKAPCVLDGEIVVLKDGKPDLYSLLKKTKAGVTSIPGIMAEYAVFDILFYDGQDLLHLPLIERKKLLFDKVEEKNELSLVRYFENCGISFYKLAKEQRLEGIVAKQKDSPYVMGKRTQYWLKIK